jgi:hypothetical protein
MDSTHLFRNHINRVLRSAIRDDWDDGGINDTEVLDAMDTELRVDNSLINALGKTGCTARICDRLLDSLFQKNTGVKATYGIQSETSPTLPCSLPHQNG